MVATIAAVRAVVGVAVWDAAVHYLQSGRVAQYPLVPTDWLRQQTYLTTSTQQRLLQSRSAQVVVEVEPVQMQVFFMRVSDLRRQGAL